MSKPDPKPLVPPDLERCQALGPKLGPFTMGGRIGSRERCSNRPTIVITEAEPGPDGQRGSMSLCDACLAIAKKQSDVPPFMGIPITIEPIDRLPERARACVDEYERAVAEWKATPGSPRPIPSPAVTFAAAYLAQRAENDLLRTKASLTLKPGVPSPKPKRRS